MAEPVLSAQWLSGGVWTALGAPRAAVVDRGRDQATASVKAGTLVLTMPNQVRQLDPVHTPAVAELRAGASVRLRASWGGVTYDLFTGYLERMTQHFGNPDRPRDATAVLECVDGIGILAPAELDTAFAIAMRGVKPRAWYRLDETKGNTAYDRAGPNHGSYGGVPELAVASLLAGDDDPAVKFAAAPGGGPYLVLPPGFVPTTPSWSIRFTFQLNAIPASVETIFRDTRYPRGGIRIGVDNAGKLTVGITDEAGGVPATATASAAFGIAPNVGSVTIVGVAGQPLKIYNGTVDWTGPTSGTTPVLTPGYTTVGYVTNLDLTLDELVSFDHALSAAEIGALTHGAFGWVGDYIWQRIPAVLDSVGWPTALRDYPADPVQLRVFEPATALEHLQAIEATIEGRLFVSASGTLVLLSRTEHLGAPYDVSAATLSDVPGALGYREIGGYTQGWDDVSNLVRRTIGEDVIAAWDVDSIARYGLRVVDVDSLAAELSAEYDLAQWRVAHYRDPIPHVDGLAIQPRTDDALWPVALGLDLGRRITFQRTPQGVGSPLVSETIIEGIRHDIGPKHWTTTYRVDATYAQRYFQFDSTLWNDPGWRFAA